MGSDEGSRDRESRRRRHRDDDERPDSHPRRRSRDRDSEKRRERDRSADHGKKERRRSRTPEPSRRRRSRSRSRDGDRLSRRHRDERRDRDPDSDRHRRRRSPNDEKEHKRSRRTRDDDDAPQKKRAPSPFRRGAPLPSQNDSFAVETGDLDAAPAPKEQPNFGTSGALAKASNSVQQADGTTVALKYHEPGEARKPPARDDWKLFVFKGDDVVDTIGLSARSCWLVGREVAVVDLAAEHPSISKQHAVVQFRHVEKRNEFGDRIGKVRPYLIDLESANGTELNGKKIAESRYVELRDKDVVKFGHSTREYVVMLARE